MVGGWVKDLSRGGERRTYEVPGDATPRGPAVGGDVREGAHGWVAGVGDAGVDFNDTALGVLAAGPLLGDLVLSGHQVSTLGDEVGWDMGWQR